MNQEQPTQAPTGEVAKRDWDQIVADNNNLFHVPAHLLDRAKEWDKERKEFEAEAAVLAEKESALQNKLMALLHDIRKHLSENGVPRAFTMDTGFETSALNEGKFVVYVSQQNNRR